ncbi:DMT family transporter [Azospirillum thermophilum]|uniref:EamA family transporter n=1 Tax=Azospirillum thermophilum TaxID=2202148 RepID=A0A2S2CTD8_9PROT|nr:DMT family transporter [Azospirillum thermophilum]AWK87729.1 EamA family transporter [Azospirillum thermophilum]
MRDHGDHGRERRAGIAMALGSALLFGASTPLAKLLVGGLSPWLLAGLLYLGSGLGLALVRRLRPAAEAPLARGDYPWLAAAILCGGVVGPLLLMSGLEAGTASAASLLLNLEGVFTLAIAWVVFRENVDLRVGLGAAAILLGAVLLSWEGGSLSLGGGSLLVAGACLAWAVDNNLTRRLSAADPVQIAMLKGAVAGTVNIALAVAAGAELPDAGTMLAAGLVGFLGYGVSLVLFVLALRHLGTARTGAYFSLAPFVGALLAVAALGEPLSLRFVLAALLMAAGLALHLMERHEHPHEHEPMEHAHRHVHDAHHRHDHGPDDPPGEPHVHRHAHPRLVHRHPHYPDLHHRHEH